MKSSLRSSCLPPSPSRRGLTPQGVFVWAPLKSPSRPALKETKLLAGWRGARLQGIRGALKAPTRPVPRSSPHDCGPQDPLQPTRPFARVCAPTQCFRLSVLAGWHLCFSFRPLKAAWSLKSDCMCLAGRVEPVGAARGVQQPPVQSGGFWSGGSVPGGGPSCSPTLGTGMGGPRHAQSH